MTCKGVDLWGRGSGGPSDLQQGASCVLCLRHEGKTSLPENEQGKPDMASLKPRNGNAEKKVVSTNQE